MKTIFTLIACGLFCSFSYGQTAKELYKEKNYKELVKLERKSDELSGDELYMISYGFFRLENKGIQLRRSTLQTEGNTAKHTINIYLDNEKSIR